MTPAFHPCDGLNAASASAYAVRVDLPENVTSVSFDLTANGTGVVGLRLCIYAAGALVDTVVGSPPLALQVEAGGPLVAAVLPANDPPGVFAALSWHLVATPSADRPPG